MEEYQENVNKIASITSTTFLQSKILARLKLDVQLLCVVQTKSMKGSCADEKCLHPVEQKIW
jgi:hypothetical protein